VVNENLVFLINNCFFQDVAVGPAAAHSTLWKAAKVKHTPKGIDNTCIFII
jgi:hypothetical protein